MHDAKVLVYTKVTIFAVYCKTVRVHAFSLCLFRLSSTRSKLHFALCCSYKFAYISYVRLAPFSSALQESEWLRETLHKWLDDEYCPEPTNVDISNTAARSYYESLMAKQSDLGEILLKMVEDLEKLSYQESFHGAFSAANAAVRLITQRMELSSSGE